MRKPVKPDQSTTIPGTASSNQSPLSNTDSGQSDPLTANKSNTLPNRSDEVDAFLDAVQSSTPPSSADGRGRLIFSLDATASRQATWDRAMALQSDMFVKTRGIAALDVQLVYYRGYRECRASRWIGQADQLLLLMKKVSCEAGRTQIERVLRHGIAETRLKPVQALVFVGDCMEENIDLLGDLAGQCRILGLPVFIFQEGYDPQASMAFKSIAQLSGGAHCRFDESSASQLGELLNAVAVYAAGGRQALLQLGSSGSRQAKLLLEQLG